MASLDHVTVLRSERDRIAGLLPDADMTRRVPACPDWTLADLAWHLIAGSTFWVRSIEEGLDDPGTVIDHGAPRADELAARFEETSARLVDVLASRPPETPCWSWHPAGGTIGWVRRRQAHEMLIHRVDVEQSLGSETQPVAGDVAADGAAEMIAVMLTGTPDWAVFSPEDSVVRIATTDTGSAWTGRFGRCAGTTPSGTAVDLDAIELVADGHEPDLTITATAVDLYLWLWRRTTDGITAAGDVHLFERTERLVADVTR
jgi:uncharacterized protein (TIGR03083 family)